MNELAKKFYWLIITTSLPAMFFIASYAYKNISSSISIWDSIKMSKVIKYSDVESFAEKTEKRHNTLYKIRDVIFKKQFDRLMYSNILVLSLDYDYEIQNQIYQVEDDLIEKFGRKVTDELKSLNDDIKNMLNMERDIWKHLGDYSITYIEDKKNFNELQFYVDFRRKLNAYISMMEQTSYQITYTTFTRPIINDLIRGTIGIFSAILVIGMGFLYFMYLVPYGFVLWNKSKIKKSLVLKK